MAGCGELRGAARLDPPAPSGTSRPALRVWGHHGSGGAPGPPVCPALRPPPATGPTGPHMAAWTLSLQTRLAGAPAAGCVGEGGDSVARPGEGHVQGMRRAGTRNMAWGSLWRVPSTESRSQQVQADPGGGQRVQRGLGSPAQPAPCPPMPVPCPWEDHLAMPARHCPGPGNPGVGLWERAPLRSP